MTTPEQEITVELERLEEDSVHSAANQFALGQQYRMIELVAGVPASVLKLYETDARKLKPTAQIGDPQHRGIRTPPVVSPRESRGNDRSNH